MKWLTKASQLCVATALVGCSSVGNDYVYNNAEERSPANRAMVEAYYNEQAENGVIRQKTVYTHHFLSDTPVLNELGERDLLVLAAHYRDNVLPHISQRNVLKEVKVYFDYNKSNVRSDAVPDLDTAIQLLADNPKAELLISGGADARGSAEYNAVLGEQRADAVRAYLDAKGVSANRVRIVSRGELDATAPETDEAGMQDDRNAHFMVAELQEFPVSLNVKQGNASNELYHARKKVVRGFLNANGVNTDLVAIGDGLPGGDGMSSERVVVILSESYGPAVSAAPVTSAGPTGIE